MKYDLHTHSKYSADGFLEPEKIVETGMRKDSLESQLRTTTPSMGH